MKTYKLEELESTRKTNLDYAAEHKQMLESLKENSTPAAGEEPNHFWPLPASHDPFHQKGLLDERIEEGSWIAGKRDTDD